MEEKDSDGESGMRTRSFRNEDYNNRRVFLRSYPLQWGGEDERSTQETERSTQETEGSTHRSDQKKPLKKIVLSMFHWGGGKVLVLKRFKNKITVYVIACIPVRFKALAAQLSA